MRSELDVRIERQPDYTTCGPTALHAINRYYGDPIDLATVIGEVVWGDLKPELIATQMLNGTPLLAGTSGTYLYQSARETDEGPDDIRGEAFGQFIVVCGFDSGDQSVAIADPLLDNPAHGTKYYRASVFRLIGAIFLGVESDDGNLLLIRPKGSKWRRDGAAS